MWPRAKLLLPLVILTTDQQVGVVCMCSEDTVERNDLCPK